MHKRLEQVTSFSKETTTFTWILENFSSLGMSCDFTESSPIKCSETILCLRLYSNQELNGEKGIKLTLNEISSSKERFTSKIGFMDRQGVLWNPESTCIKRRERTAEKNPTNHPFCFGAVQIVQPIEVNSVSSNSNVSETFLKKATLLENSTVLLVDDVLTVFCELNVISATRGDVTEIPSKCTMTLATDMKSLLDDPSHSDVTLRVGKVEFLAHKAILGCRSTVFRAMFESGMKECQENTSELVEMKPSAAQSMLQFIYTGVLEELSMEDALDVYAAADKYDLQELKGWCKALIMRYMSADHVCDVSVLANLHSDKDLADAACRTLKNNLQQVLTTEKWRNFAKQNPALYTELLEKAVLM